MKNIKINESYFSDLTVNEKHEAWPDALFRTMADHAPALLWLAREDGLSTFFNASWIEFTGRAIEQEWGLGWAEGMHPEDYSTSLVRYLDIFRRREPLEMKYRLRRHDGQYRWILNRGTPIFDKGVFRGYIGSCTDITDLYIANAALEQKNRDLAAAMLRADTITTKFMAAIMAAPAGMLMLDKDNKIILVNEKIEGLFGYSASELHGQAVEMLLPGHAYALQRSFGESPVHPLGETQDMFGVRKDGTHIPVEIGLSPVVTSEGNFTISSVIDISAHKKNEDRLRNLAATLEKSNEELENFAYLASHDLQAPMRSIVSFAGLIKEQLDASQNTEVAEYLDILCKAARDMKALLQALLSYSRVGGKKEISMLPIDLGDLLTSIVEESFPKPDEMHAVYDKLPTVVGDPVLLKHLFSNLISNAFKFRKPGTTAHVTITCEDREDAWHIAVSDQGLGMSSSFVGRAFAIFAREDGRQNIQGTGIGLAICKKIAAMHQADIWCQSTLGEGTTFYLDLPKASKKTAWKELK